MCWLFTFYPCVSWLHRISASRLGSCFINLDDIFEFLFDHYNRLLFRFLLSHFWLLLVRNLPWRFGQVFRSIIFCSRVLIPQFISRNRFWPALRRHHHFQAVLVEIFFEHRWICFHAFVPKISAIHLFSLVVRRQLWLERDQLHCFIFNALRPYLLLLW